MRKQSQPADAESIQRQSADAESAGGCRSDSESIGGYRFDSESSQSADADQNGETDVADSDKAKDAWRGFSLDHTSRGEACPSTLGARRPEARVLGGAAKRPTSTRKMNRLPRGNRGGHAAQR
jgi:hypothetical protein